MNANANAKTYSANAFREYKQYITQYTCNDFNGTEYIHSQTCAQSEAKLRTVRYDCVQREYIFAFLCKNRFRLKRRECERRIDKRRESQRSSSHAKQYYQTYITDSIKMFANSIILFWPSRLRTTRLVCSDGNTKSQFKIENLAKSSQNYSVRFSIKTDHKCNNKV